MKIVINILCIILIFIALCLTFAACKSPKTYEFQYSVKIEKDNNTEKLITSNTVIETFYPDKIKFSLSSRLRLYPCLILGEIGTLSSTNIACKVISFDVIYLKYIQIK